MTSTIDSMAFYGFLASGNLGNDASLETALAWFRDHYPHLRFSCITIAPEAAAARFQIPSVALRSPGAGSARGRGTGTLGKLTGRIADLRRTFELAGSADVVVIPGMGVLEEALGTKPWGLPSWLFLLAVACKIRRRPLVLLGVGAEPICNRLTRKLYAAVVQLAAHVSYRDNLSRDAMVQAGARRAAAVIPDIVFAHPTPLTPHPQPGLLVVGVMAYYGSTDDPIQGAGIRQRYVRSMTEALISLIESGHRVVLVGGDQVDVDVAHEIKNAVAATGSAQMDGESITIQEPATFDELSAVMAQADVVVASRFHNLICALKHARPTVSIGYAEKSDYLMNSLGLSGYCQVIDQLDSAQLVAQVKQAHADRDALSELIAQQTARFGDRVRSLLIDLAEDLGLQAPAVQPSGRSG